MEEVCYLDFRKAFDSVNHRLLLKKLEAWRIADTTRKWIENFLHQRSFWVEVEGARSRRGIATSGVPQGSVLGSLLFLVYIYDLVRGLKNPYYLFADDVKIVGNIREGAIQEDLDIIQK